ncbi:MAG: Uma2 family endonuclease [Cyanomargarita calcarea GSE-NOS-MK-12-04C]|jgi:Uma2 family endonuclease|uniref:Uma2 family endonuclease n=1 Tax=Cyanomargarita calcarea GSE-NOS-MK-12-04C TaxID=2839659 RepID=A0A951QU43_9CYAN|nr:Uma2 family endonuclease [Cyanomargarita calcarea GSE-NOS-MK-12-04C]
MTQAQPKLVTFEAFAAWRPENGRYELHDGIIVEMAQPLGGHEKVTGFLARKVTLEFDKLDLPYFIPKKVLVKPLENESGYEPDVLLINDNNLVNEPLWKKSSTVIYGASIPLIVEVVSTNWDDDYYMKQGRYESMGIPEYWIADYLGLGAKKFTGNPKQPTFSVYQLIDEEYQVSQFRGSDRIVSPTFPQLNLTAQQIFDAAL